MILTRILEVSCQLFFRVPVQAVGNLPRRSLPRRRPLIKVVGFHGWLVPLWPLQEGIIISTKTRLTQKRGATLVDQERPMRRKTQRKAALFGSSGRDSARSGHFFGSIGTSSGSQKRYPKKILNRKRT